MSQPNPYDSPAPIANPAKTYNPGTGKIDFGGAFRFVLTNPNWMMALLWGSLCFLLSSLIVPQIIFSGYLWEVIERLHKRETTSYADFDTNRLSDYLMRGVWPFLVQMLLSLVLVVLVVPLVMCGGFAMAISGANDAPELGLVAFFLLFGVMMLVVMVFQVMMTPFVLRAGLAQDLGTAFNLGWAKEFVGLVWKELLLWSLVLAGAMVVAYIVGMLLFCVGIYPAIVVCLFANTHFVWQVYELYLRRGGTPIPLKGQPAVV